MSESYKLTIVRFVDNPDYAEQLAEYTRSRAPYNDFGRTVMEPSRRIEDRQLDVTVTADEFKAIKRAVLEIA